MRTTVFRMADGGPIASNVHYPPARRWWNNPWRVVEPKGQNAAADWSAQNEVRLNELVHYAHEQGFWIRFYALNGVSAANERRNGWFHIYNFGSLEAARIRWRAAIRAGVDFLSVDQYEELAKELKPACSLISR